MLVNAYGQTVLERVQRIDQELQAAAKALSSGNSKAQSAAHLVFSVLPNGRRLAIVTRLAEHHNMGLVARELNVTNAAISAALKDLESRFRVSLFARSPKGLIPTTAGETLAFHFRRSLAELRHIVPDLAAMDGIVRGIVHIGALPLGRTRILPFVIATVVTKHPQLHIVTTESPYRTLAAQLRSGELDLVFGALRPSNDAKDLHQEPLFDDQVSVIARAGHPLASRRTLKLRELRTAQWILWREDAPARELLRRFFPKSGEPAPQPSIETGDLGILRGVLRHSDILAAISAQQLHHEIASGELVILPIHLMETRRSIGIAQRQGALPSPGTRALLDEIRARVSSMIESGDLLAMEARESGT
jgi:LysR family transcriptional regulator of gallate degradation